MIKENLFTPLLKQAHYNGFSEIIHGITGYSLVIDPEGYILSYNESFAQNFSNLNANTIIMTGCIQLEKKSELYKIGIKGILSKPLNFDQILKAVLTILDIEKNNSLNWYKSKFLH